MIKICAKQTKQVTNFKQMKKALLVLRFMLGLTLLSFIGIQYGTEFHEPTFFIKHKPNFKISYFSPIGESDNALEDLAENLKIEVVKYREFVKSRNLSPAITWLTPLLIALSSFLITSVISNSYVLPNRKTKAWKLFLAKYFIHLFLFALCYWIYWNWLGYGFGILTIIFYWILCLVSSILIGNEIVLKKKK